MLLVFLVVVHFIGNDQVQGFAGASSRRGFRHVSTDAYFLRLSCLRTTGSSLLPSLSSSIQQQQEHNCDGRSSKEAEEEETQKRKKKKGPSIHPKLERPRIPILQYHDDWVCVNKPAQMSVHRSSGAGGRRQKQQQFVVNTLLKRQLSRKVWPVHRLDHRTSGALLFAFSSEVCGQLHASLTDKTDANKVYIALLRGDWRNLPETMLVDRPVTVDDGTRRNAQTEFRWLASISDSSSLEETADDDRGKYSDYRGACSLVSCRLLTGRKHQIRRHAFHIGHPILGDSEHGDSKVNRWWRKNRNLDRLFLHCLSLDLPPLKQKKEEEEEDGGGGAGDPSADCNPSQTTPAPTTKGDDSYQPSRIQCVAPLPPELSSVLRRQDMQSLWQLAVKKEPRLAMEPYDERGGTFGRGRAKNWQLENKNRQLGW